MLTIEKYEASWCQPCKMLEPIVNELKNDFINVEFKSIDVDDEYQAAQLNEVRSVPTLIFKDSNGKEIERVLGVKQKSDIQQLIEKHLE